MQIENIIRQFQKAGYKRAIVKGAFVDVLLQIQPQCVYVVIMMDCVHLTDLTLEKYESIVRAIRKSIYKYDFPKVEILEVLCTEKPESVKSCVPSYGEHWIIDLMEEQLLIYEDQTAEFSDARDIIEKAIEEGDLLEKEKAEARKRYIKDNICTLLLVFLNIIYFLWVEFTGSSLDMEHMIQAGALYTDSIGQGFWYYEIISSMFLHFGIEHIAGNMFMLLALGQFVEKRLGKVFFLTVYLGSGIIGNLAQIYDMLQNHGQTVVAAGASGAVYGMMGALIYIVMRNRGQIEGLSLGNIVLLTIFGVCNLFLSKDVNYAHIGGLIGGFILTKMIYLVSGKEEINA